MKIVTLCGCGLGTCFILKFTAEKALQELGLEAEVVPGGISGCNMETADLYIVPYGLNVDSISNTASVVAIRNVVRTDEIKQAIQEWIVIKQKDKG